MDVPRVVIRRIQDDDHTASLPAAHRYVYPELITPVNHLVLPKDSPPRGFLQQPPELVIEVFGDDASWATMDEQIADYHGAGVDLVWVLDPRTRTLHAHPRGAAPELLRESDTPSAGTRT